MHLIIGGRCMGKRAYAEKLYGRFEIEYDLESEDPENIARAGLIVNLHMGVKALLMRGSSPVEFFTSRLEALRPCVIVGDDISGGVVPIDAFMRLWRDETGQVYQLLAREADIVDRVFAGLALRLKG